MRPAVDLTNKIDQATYKRLVEEMVHDLRCNPSEFHRLVLADLIEEHGAEGCRERTTQYLRGIELVKVGGDDDSPAEQVWVERKEGPTIPLSSLDIRAVMAILTATYQAWSKSGYDQTVAGIRLPEQHPQRRGEFRADWTWAEGLQAKRNEFTGLAATDKVKPRLRPTDYRYLWICCWKYRHLILVGNDVIAEAERVWSDAPEEGVVEWVGPRPEGIEITERLEDTEEEPLIDPDTP